MAYVLPFLAKILPKVAQLLSRIQCLSAFLIKKIKGGNGRLNAVTVRISSVPLRHGSGRNRVQNEKWHKDCPYELSC